VSNPRTRSRTCASSNTFPLEPAIDAARSGHRIGSPSVGDARGVVKEVSDRMRPEIVGIYAGRGGGLGGLRRLRSPTDGMDWYLLRQAHVGRAGRGLSRMKDWTLTGSGPNCECSRMYASCVLIGPATLRRMYVEELRTTDQIAAHFGCSGTTVRRHLRRFKIPVRPRGPCVGRIRSRHGFAPTFPRWSADVAYVVGLIATDGNLGRKKPVITLVSKDTDLLETVRRCLGLIVPIKSHSGGYGDQCRHLAWHDRSLYEWLRGIGLTPAKSLTLGPLSVPDEYFADFFRGCIDGDGSIRVYTDRYHVPKCERYVYERLYVSIVSASRAFIEWLCTTVSRLTGVTGSLTVRHRPGAHPLWMLRYAKAKSIRLIVWMYYSPTVPCLARKRSKAERFLLPLGVAPALSTGRPRVGWLYNAASGNSEVDGKGKPE